MEERELDQLILETLPPDGRATLEECVDALVAELEEEGFDESPARLRVAAQAFNRKGCDEDLPIDQQLVAHQIAAALRMRAEALVN